MTKEIVELPYKFIPRPYQKPVLKALFQDNKKRIVKIWHRRAGKDKEDMNIIVIAAMMRKGTYFYIFPQLTQARRNIWHGMDKDGMPFLDHIPDELIVRRDKKDMLIELVNGSIIQFLGSDYYEPLRGSNPVGVVLSEYSKQNPRAWDEVLRPILAENDGWVIFQYTPHGTNHGYQLYQTNKDNPDWFIELLTVDDTVDENGVPYVSKERIEADRRSGMSEDQIQQEYYCSFNAAVRGAYFATELARAHKNDKIIDFPYDRRTPVSTYWDIGYNDATAIWFVQIKQNELIALHYYEDNFKDLQFYINYLHDWKEKHGIVFDKHFSPHDGRKHDWTTGKTQVQMAAELGLNFQVVPRVQHKVDAIEMARSYFNKFTFHKTECKFGLSCLTEYHSDFNEKMNVYSNQPAHNWASHCADAFMAIAQSNPHRSTFGIQIHKNSRPKIFS